jgi:pyruvate dehydrogenase E1 component alpha subunit
MGSHSSSDDAARYRDAEEFERWKERDPIARFQRYLQKKKIWTEAFETELHQELRGEINDAIKRAEARPKPPAESIFDDVFMNLSPQLTEQREEFLGLEGPASEEMGEFPL